MPGGEGFAFLRGDWTAQLLTQHSDYIARLTTAV